MSALLSLTGLKASQLVNNNFHGPVYRLYECVLNQATLTLWMGLLPILSVVSGFGQPFIDPAFFI